MAGRGATPSGRRAPLRYAGELAALGTALCWATGFNFFAAAGKHMGSKALNRLRLLVAFVLLSLALLVTRGTPWPVWATPFQIGVLALSGLVGFVFGDGFNFKQPCGDDFLSTHGFIYVV